MKFQNMTERTSLIPIQILSTKGIYFVIAYLHLDNEKCLASTRYSIQALAYNFAKKKSKEKGK